MNDIVHWLGDLLGHWQHWASGGGLGGAAILVINLIERLRERTMPKRWYALVFIVLFIIGASFLTWEDQNNLLTAKTSETVKLTGKLDELTKPRFDFHPLLLIMGSFAGTFSSHMGMLLRLSNLGSDSAIAEDTWHISAVVSGGTIYAGDVIMLAPGNTDFCVNDQSGKAIGIRRFVQDESIYARASKVIHKDEYVIGVLTVLFRGLKRDILAKSDTSVIITAMSTRGLPIEGRFVISDIAALKGHIALPSINNPIMLPVQTTTCPSGPGITGSWAK
jgi:hypothetical protein